MIIVKLGGSVITDKKRPLTARPRAIEALAAALAGVDEPLVVVHGGGSFGHYWSVRHGMHTKPARHAPAAVAAVKNSMVDLDALVLRAMARAGLGPYVVPPHALLRPGGTVLTSAVGEVKSMAESGTVPVTYGDALWKRGGLTYIMSGDVLVRLLSFGILPRLAVFATDVDGLYSDLRARSLIERVGRQDAERLAGLLPGGGSGGSGARPRGRGHALPGRGAAAAAGPDVTGGIGRKVRESMLLSEFGIDVAFVNGNKPERILEAAAATRGEGRGRFAGTLFAADARFKRDQADQGWRGRSAGTLFDGAGAAPRELRL